jgi:hypothetical protein
MIGSVEHNHKNYPTISSAHPDQSFMTRGRPSKIKGRGAKLLCALLREAAALLPFGLCRGGELTTQRSDDAPPPHSVQSRFTNCVSPGARRRIPV